MQQLVDLPEVLRRRRVDERDVLRGFREPDVLVLVTGVLAQFPAQLAEPVEHAADSDRGRLRSNSSMISAGTSRSSLPWT